MIYQHLKKNEKLRKEILIKELQSRGQEDRFFKNVDLEINRIEEKKIKDWEDHIDLLHLHRRVYHHPNSNPRMKPGSQIIVKMSKQIDLVYLLEKAAIINEKIFRNRILQNENHDVEHELNIWKTASDEVTHPAIALYRLRFDYNEANRLEQFFELKKRYFSIYKKLNLKEQKIHLLSLLNDYSILFRQGKLKFADSLELFKLGIENEILFDEGKLVRSRYITIVSVSNTKGDFEYTEHFILEYTKRLDQKIQSDALNWAKAHTEYRKGNLSKSLDFLIGNEFKNPHFQLASKVLGTQVYFDLFLEDASYQLYLFNYFDTFEKWILRDNTREKRLKDSFLKFIQNTRKLAKFYLNVNVDNEKMEQFLLKEKNVQAFDWLRKRKKEVLKRKKNGHPNL